MQLSDELMTSIKLRNGKAMDNVPSEFSKYCCLLACELSYSREQNGVLNIFNRIKCLEENRNNGMKKCSNQYIRMVTLKYS